MHALLGASLLEKVEHHLLRAQAAREPKENGGHHAFAQPSAVAYTRKEPCDENSLTRPDAPARHRVHVEFLNLSVGEPREEHEKNVAELDECHIDLGREGCDVPCIIKIASAKDDTHKHCSAHLVLARYVRDSAQWKQEHHHDAHRTRNGISSAAAAPPKTYPVVRTRLHDSPLECVCLSQQNLLSRGTPRGVNG